MTLSRIKYVETVPEFEAEQYTGGRENATALADWLADHEIHTAWYDAIPEINVEETEDAPAQKLDGQPERLVIELTKGSLVAVPTNWIVVDQDHTPFLFTDAQFQAFYTQKRGD